MNNERIEKLETQLFLLSMKDKWTPEDYLLDAKLTAELRELKS